MFGEAPAELLSELVEAASGTGSALVRADHTRNPKTIATTMSTTSAPTRADRPGCVSISVSGNGVRNSGVCGRSEALEP